MTISIGQKGERRDCHRGEHRFTYLIGDQVNYDRSTSGSSWNVFATYRLPESDTPFYSWLRTHCSITEKEDCDRKRKLVKLRDHLTSNPEGNGEVCSNEMDKSQEGSLLDKSGKRKRRV